MKICVFNFTLLLITFNTFAMEESSSETVRGKPLKIKKNKEKDKKRIARQDSIKWEAEIPSEKETQEKFQTSDRPIEEEEYSDVSGASSSTAEVEIREKKENRKLIDESLRKIFFKSEQYRLFSDEPRDLSFIFHESNKKKNLSDQEYKEYLRQKIDDAIAQRDFIKLILTKREIELFDQERNNLAVISKLQKNFTNRLRNGEIKQCCINTSIVYSAMLILLVALIIFKYS